MPARPQVERSRGRRQRPALYPATAVGDETDADQPQPGQRRVAVVGDEKASGGGAPGLRGREDQDVPLVLSAGCRAAGRACGGRRRGRRRRGGRRRHCGRPLPRRPQQGRQALPQRPARPGTHRERLGEVEDAVERLV